MTREKRGGGKETAEFKDISNYCGLVLHKASYFKDILNGIFLYEIRTTKKTLIPYKVVFHPDRILRDNGLWNQNIEAWLCEDDDILGPYSSKDKLLHVTNDGEHLGMSKEEFNRLFEKKSGKSFYLYPLSRPSVSNIIWNDSPVANQFIFSNPEFMHGQILKTLFRFPEGIQNKDKHVEKVPTSFIYISEFHLILL